MKFFEEPKLDVLKFAVEDVITVSAAEEESLGLFEDPCYG